MAGEGTAGELLCADTGNSNLRRTLQAAGRRLKRVRFEAVQFFFEEFVSQLEVRVKNGDQTGFYKRLEGINLEGRRLCSVQYIKDEQSIDCFETRDLFVIGGCTDLTLYLTLSRERST